MKKHLLLLTVTIFLGGCFQKEEKVLITENKVKSELINEIVQKDNTEAQKKYEAIVSKLKDQASDGNMVAKQEYEEWVNKYDFAKSYGKGSETPVLGQKKIIIGGK